MAATRAEQCHTYPHLPCSAGARVGRPAATTGACNAVINGPSVRSYSPGPVDAGCQPASNPSHEAITRGARCTSAVPGTQQVGQQPRRPPPMHHWFRTTPNSGKSYFPHILLRLCRRVQRE